MKKREQSPVYTKDPAEELDYKIDWKSTDDDGPYLASDETILASTWTTTPSGLTVGPTLPSHNGTAATIWLSGGDSGKQYQVSNRITTSYGRTAKRSFFVMIQPR